MDDITKVIDLLAGKIRLLPPSVARELIQKVEEVVKQHSLQAPQPTPPEPPQLMTVKDVAERLGITRQQALRFMRKLPYVVVGGGKKRERIAVKVDDFENHYGQAL